MSQEGPPAATTAPSAIDLADTLSASSSSSSSTSAASVSSSLKRRASSSFDCSDDNTRKRLKEAAPDGHAGAMDTNTNTTTTTQAGTTMQAGVKLADDLAEELNCGCCSEVVYKPVLVMPCQHFFCGSCCVLWIRNGGTNCPACRSLVTSAIPFRAIQPILETLLRAAPHKARTERERQQADEVYKSQHGIRFPPPREASPPPEMERSADYVHPCPHCVAGNPYEWRCSQPVPDPTTDPDNAWHVDDGVPPGHAHCGNCETLLATRAPSSTRCDFCLVSFCGIGVQDRCIALPLQAQHPHNLSTHADLIQSADVYESFEGNTYEVEVMLEYVEAQRLTAKHIYRDIVQHIQKQPRGFRPLLELDLFSELHAVAPSAEYDPNAPRNRACRLCAAEIFLWGLKEWWVRERRKGFVEEEVMARKDCVDGVGCVRQKDDHAHAREFNHIFAAPTPPGTEPSSAQVDAAPTAGPSTSASSTTNATTSNATSTSTDTTAETTTETTTENRPSSPAPRPITFPPPPTGGNTTTTTTSDAESGSGSSSPPPIVFSSSSPPSGVAPQVEGTAFSSGVQSALVVPTEGASASSSSTNASVPRSASGVAPSSSISSLSFLLNAEEDEDEDEERNVGAGVGARARDAIDMES